MYSHMSHMQKGVFALYPKFSAGVRKKKGYIAAEMTWIANKLSNKKEHFFHFFTLKPQAKPNSAIDTAFCTVFLYLLPFNMF